MLAVAVGLSGCGLGALLGEAQATGNGRFVLSFDENRIMKLRAVSEQLKTAGDAERAVDRLNKRVRMPEDVDIVVRSCKDGSLYDPQKLEIQVCLEEIVEARELMSDDPPRERKVTERGILVDTINHEGAHALLDVYDLAFTGRQEDVADQFSSYMSMRRGAEGLDDLESAAYGYELLAHAYEHSSSDEHASDAQRAINYQCYVYGAAKRNSKHLIAKDGLTKDRAEFCWEEWQDLRDGWHRLLGQAGALR